MDHAKHIAAFVIASSALCWAVFTILKRQRDEDHE